MQVTYPGVYIQEVPSGVRTIASVSTSIAAFIDFFREGPMDEAVQIFGMTDFQRVYGGLEDQSPASYAISQFFLNGGSEAYVVRVASGTPASASVQIRTSAAGGAGTIMTVTASSAGEWGESVRVLVEHNVDPADTFNMIVRRYDGTAGDANLLVEESFLSLSVDPTNARYFPTLVNDGSALVQVIHESATTNLPAPTSTLGAAVTLTAVQINALNGTTFDVEMENSATVSASGTATLGPWGGAGQPPAPTDLRELRSFIEQAIRAIVPAENEFIQSFAGATVELIGDRYLVRPGPRAAAYDPEQIVIISGAAASTADQLGFLSTPGRNVQECILGTTTNRGAQANGAGGDDGTPPDAVALRGVRANKTGLYALEDVDLFNILCVPRSAQLDATQMDAFVAEALGYCTERRAFMIIDVPATINDLQEMREWMDDNAGFRHRNAAVYFPHPRLPDSLNEFRLRTVGASGTMAGIYARTDSNRGVWKAPAGIEAQLRGVSELDVKLTDGQNGALNPLGINCLRTFPIHGPIAWGGRTLQGADAIGSEWKYIPVRRLTLMIEESLFRGTKWVVFEPNDEPLWANIRLNVGAFMNSLFRQGAFQGASPQEAYYVKCDSETTTQNDINLGIVNIEVGFAPLKPAEFVVIKIQQIAGDL